MNLPTIDSLPLYPLGCKTNPKGQPITWFNRVELPEVYAPFLGVLLGCVRWLFENISNKSNQYL
jgi:hypothetical protein